MGDENKTPTYAKIIRDEYTRLKKSIVGQDYKPKLHKLTEEEIASLASPNTRRPSVWVAAARLCLELGAHPVSFVEAAFEQCRLSTGPFPNMLRGQSMRYWWKQYLANRPVLDAVTKICDAKGLKGLDTELTNNYVVQLQQDILNIRKILKETTGTWKLTLDNLSILQRPTFPTTPYLRVLLTWTESGGDDIIKQYFGQQALDMFTKRPNLENAARLLGYPMTHIIQWLRHETPTSS